MKKYLTIIIIAILTVILMATFKQCAGNVNEPQTEVTTTGGETQAGEASSEEKSASEDKGFSELIPVETLPDESENSEVSNEGKNNTSKNPSGNTAKKDESDTLKELGDVPED